MMPNNDNRNLVLALYVLSNVLTEKQLTDLIATGIPLPDTWQGIVKQVNEFRNSGAQFEVAPPEDAA